MSINRVIISGNPVSYTHLKSSKGKNKIEIEFKDEEDLRRLFSELVGE